MKSVEYTLVHIPSSQIIAVHSRVQGLVALLGDSAHAMQPNLGQGGCMAIEDGYQLAVDLSEAAQRAETAGSRVDVEEILKVCRSVCKASHSAHVMPFTAKSCKKASCHKWCWG